MTSPSLVYPRIGAVWPGQGGVFAGLIRNVEADADEVLILADAVPASAMRWKTSCDWATKLEIEGHRDFMLPDQREGRLLWVNLKPEFKPEWYWLRTQYSQGHAWGQNFNLGGQGTLSKGNKFFARAVRRFNPSVLQSF